MKKFRSIFAAVVAICLVQGLFAVAPGGTLGGGGKATQQQASDDKAPVVQPVMELPNFAADEQMETSAESAQTTTAPMESKSVMGKQSQSGQANQEVDEKSYNEALAHNADKKAMRRQLKDTLKQLKANRNENESSKPMNDMLILCVILALFIPPLAVYLYLGEIGTEFWISLILTLLFFLPGVIYSLFVILTK